VSASWGRSITGTGTTVSPRRIPRPNPSRCSGFSARWPISGSHTAWPRFPPTP
jgi:hypothetical protein